MFETLDRRHVLALVALDALDEDFGGGALLLGFRFGRSRFGRFLFRVFSGPFLSFEGEGGEVLFYSFCRVGSASGNVP